MKLLFTVKIMKSIIKQDLLLSRKNFFDKFLNVSIWAIISLFVTSYILPQMGLTANFGLIQFAGVLATIGFFEAYSYIFTFIADLEYGKIIYYELGFPISSFCLFLSKIISYAIYFICLTLSMIPVAKCLLWNIISLRSFNWFYLITIIIVSSIFFASIIFFMGSFVKNISKMGNVWSRFIFPLWFMGGFQFSWKYLYQTNKIIASIDLLNPVIYINEAFKIAIFSAEGLCSFYQCILIIILFTIISFYVAFKRLQKRIDFI